MRTRQLVITVALTAALPCAAKADVTMYGFLSGALESASATGGVKEYKTTTRVVDNNSRIGFKGGEDLGNGLKGIWQVESSLRNFEQGGVNDKGQSAIFATRNTFVGLQSQQWGTFELGNIDTAYKQLTDIGLSVLPNMVTDQNTGGSVVYNRRVTRLSNSVHYYSPTLNGFRFGMTYGVDEARPTATNGTRQDDNRLSIAGNYSNSGLQLALGYDREGDKLNSSATSDGQKSITAGKLALSYTFGSGTLIGAGIEHVKTANNGSPDTTQNDWLISLSQPIAGAFTLKAGYAGLGKLSGTSVGNPDDYKARQWFVATTYDMSKRTQLYVYGSRVNNHAQQNANFPTNQLYTSGLGTSDAALAKGNNLQAVGAGLMVMF